MARLTAEPESQDKESPPIGAQTPQAAKFGPDCGATGLPNGVRSGFSPMANVRGSVDRQGTDHSGEKPPETKKPECEHSGIA